MPGENKRKHLEFIQSVINRMAENSFLVQGWCVTWLLLCLLWPARIPTLDSLELLLF